MLTTKQPQRDSCDGGIAEVVKGEEVVSFCSVLDGPVGEEGRGEFESCERREQSGVNFTGEQTGGFNRPLLGLKAQVGVLDGDSECWFVDL